MKYLSLFSGIEACTVAWQSLGWEAVAFAEFDDFPKAVLAHHYPDVPDLGDVAKITEEMVANLGPIDLVVGGSPCQNLSVAGNREGLDGDQSSLFVEQVRIFDIARRNNGARYLLWENVPGAFSTNGGDDFAYVLGAMAGGSFPVPQDGWRNSGVALGPIGLVEWRVLDAQYFGVPQRRRRIFAILDTGAWWSREPILFEQEGVCGNIAESGDEGEGVAEGAEGSVGEGCYCLQGSMIGREDKNGPQGDGINIDKSFTLNTTDRHAIAVRTAQTGANGIGVADEKAHTLDGANGQAVCFSPSSFGGYQPGVGTLRSNGGDLGGGSETIIYENHANDSRVTRCDDGVAPTLSSRMGTGGGQRPFCADPSAKVRQGGGATHNGNRTNQCRDSGREMPDIELCSRTANLLWGGIMTICFLERAGCAGGGKGILCSEEKTFTLSTVDNMRVCKMEGNNTVVRRLTPIECERLQGFPDNYTNIPWRNKPTAPDSRRYKALGTQWLCL